MVYRAASGLYNYVSKMSEYGTSVLQWNRLFESNVCDIVMITQFTKVCTAIFTK